MKQKLEMALAVMAALGVMFCHKVSAATVLSGTELTIDGTDYEVTGTLSLSKITFKTGNKIFGSGSLSLSANAVITNSAEGAAVDVPVVCAGRVGASRQRRKEHRRAPHGRRIHLRQTRLLHHHSVKRQMAGNA